MALRLRSGSPVAGCSVAAVRSAGKIGVPLPVGCSAAAVRSAGKTGVPLPFQPQNWDH